VNEQQWFLVGNQMKLLDGYLVSHTKRNQLLIRFFYLSGLAGIPPEISEIFLQHRINGAKLGTLLRGDLIHMGITKLDHQLILMQSIDLLLTLVEIYFQEFFF